MEVVFRQDEQDFQDLFVCIFNFRTKLKIHNRFAKSSMQGDVLILSLCEMPRWRNGGMAICRNAEIGDEVYAI